MKVTQIRHIEDCFDGSFIREFELDSAFDKALIQHLGKHGTLSYFPNFARPFFKVIFEGEHYIKGVEGNTMARTLLWNEQQALDIKQLIESYHLTN